MTKGSCHCGTVTWEFDGLPEATTACNCTVCRRYGTLWAYDWLDEKIHVKGGTTAYIHGDKMLGFHFCPACGCVAYWKGLTPHEENGKIRIAVNLRLAEDADEVADIPVDHFDGFDTFEDRGRDSRCVKDMWY
ncbi:MAG: GFA family protein [Alphaproteobacteria bacterium]|nr:MAG: GFA family protein [Alphaproteobacteria bacterium]